MKSEVEAQNMKWDKAKCSREVGMVGSPRSLPWLRQGPWAALQSAL